jgi:hypothetical protein
MTSDLRDKWMDGVTNYWTMKRLADFIGSNDSARFHELYESTKDNASFNSMYGNLLMSSAIFHDRAEMFSAIYDRANDPSTMLSITKYRGPNDYPATHYTPLEYAIVRGSEDIAALLAKDSRTDVSRSVYTQQHSFDLAVEHGMEKAARAISARCEEVPLNTAIAAPIELPVFAADPYLKGPIR